MREIKRERGFLHMCTYIPWNPMNTSPPSFVYASFGQKQVGEGGDPYIFVRRPLPTIECHMGARSLCFLWLFGGQNS